MGFTLNGITSQSMKIKARITSWNVSPSLRNAFETVPGKVGIVDCGMDTAERMITFRCNIYPQRTFTDLVALLDDMNEWLNPQNGLKQLICDDVPNRYFTARLTEAVDCERLLRSAGAFDLKFICPDPYGYAITDEVFTLSTAGLHSITREIGNMDSAPVYQLKAVLGSEGISLITNGEELKIIGSLSVNETLIIDTGKVTAKVIDENGDTLRNGLPNLQKLNFPLLHTGGNSIHISANNSQFEELKIYAKSRWN